jgi:NADH-quinone oxidoreductase subunit J
VIARVRAAAVLVFVLVALAAPLALAQPEGQRARRAEAPAAAEAGAADQAEQHAAEGEGEGFHNGTGAALLFWLLAFATVGGSLFVITRRNLVAAVMGMVGTFFALAGLYAMLYAHFLAVIQVLVYAGAIMVLFVFVVMILNRPEDEPWALQGLLGKALAGLAILYLLVRLSGVLWDVKDSPHAEVAAPRPQVVDTTTVGDLQTPSQALQRKDDWGSTRSVGKVLFREYLFPFEAVSLILLVAVVGGIALSRPHRESEDSAPGPNEPSGA